MLRELSLRVDSADRALIRKALEDHEVDAPSITSTNSLKRKKLETPEIGGRESRACQAACTTDTFETGARLAHVNEHLPRSRGARELGYVGQSAEIHWLHSSQDHETMEESDVLVGGPGVTPATESHRVTGASDAFFYLDSEGVELDIEVDPYEMPTNSRNSSWIAT